MEHHATLLAFCLDASSPSFAGCQNLDLFEESTAQNLSGFHIPHGSKEAFGIKSLVMNNHGREHPKEKLGGGEAELLISPSLGNRPRPWRRRWWWWWRRRWWWRSGHGTGGNARIQYQHAMLLMFSEGVSVVFYMRSTTAQHFANKESKEIKRQEARKKWRVEKEGKSKIK